jgi:hypothetical protein
MSGSCNLARVVAIQNREAGTIGPWTTMHRPVGYRGCDVLFRS